MGALAAWLGTGRRRAPLAVGALACFAGLWAVKLVVLVGAGLDTGFGVLHVLYLDAVVALPLACVALAVATRRRPRLALAALAVALLAGGTGAYASLVEPRRLVTERADVGLPAARDGKRAVRIAVLADIQTVHVGDHEHRAVKRALALRPDLIVLPGDLQQAGPRTFEREVPALRRLVRRLHAPGGVYFVLGDADTAYRARRVFAGTRVRVLVNEVTRTRVHDRTLAIAGTELNWRTPPARRAVAGVERPAHDGDVRLVLAHRPDVALTLPPRTGVDLVIAGHTHGGQVQVPMLGPPIIATEVPRDVAAGGLHTLPGGRRIYVSRGIGRERAQAPPVRFGAPPEVSLLTLR